MWGMKIFVTGGNGFIGSHLVPKLVARGHKLLLLSRNPSRKKPARNISFIKGDLNDIGAWKNKLRKFKPEAVIHLAWEGLENYDFSANVSLRNMTSGLKVVALAAEFKCRKFMSVGTCWEYGDARGALKESDSLRPATHVPDFVIAKRTIRAMGEQLALQNKMQFLWPRLFFSYGPGQKSRTLIAHLVRGLESGGQPEVKNKIGASDFVYVDDAVDAFIKILERAKGSSVIYNVGSGRLTTVAEMTKNVYKLMKEPLPDWCLKKVRPRGFYANISKIKKELGWRPKTPIERGIKKTVEYYKKSN
jgi:nucleoside-diphosphate-sugar epimerase